MKGNSALDSNLLVLLVVSIRNGLVMATCLSVVITFFSLSTSGVSQRIQDV